MTKKQETPPAEPPAERKRMTVIPRAGGSYTVPAPEEQAPEKVEESIDAG